MADFEKGLNGIKNSSVASIPQLERFAKKVFSRLIVENVPPIPYYYKVNFFNMLDEEPEEFRKQVYELIALEETNETEKDIELERHLKKTFKYTKEILQATATLYKSSQLAEELLDKYKKEIEHLANPKMVSKLIKNLEEKLSIINSKHEKELSHIKRLYSKSVEILKEVESDSVYDAKYNIYNKKFFLKELKKEVKSIDRFKHTSSLVTLKIKDEILNSLKSEKSKLLLNRSVAKIMQKTSRRTDIVAHIGDGIFGMLLKHTNKNGACQAVERLADMISNSAIFLQGEEININIVAGIVEIMKIEEVEKLLSFALEMMEKAQKDNVLYYTYEG